MTESDVSRRGFLTKGVALGALKFMNDAGIGRYLLSVWQTAGDLRRYGLISSSSS